MESHISELEITDLSGAELAFHHESGRVSLTTRSGQISFLKGAEIDEVLNSGHIAFHLFPGICVVLIARMSCRVLRFSLSEPKYETIAVIERTEVIEEGFDYAVFMGLEAGAVLCYEFGVIRLNRRGRVAWHRQFDSLLVFPTMGANELVYRGNEIEIRVPLDPGLPQ